MKKIKFLIGVAGNGFSFAPKQEVEIDEKMADSFLRAGHAELIKEAKKEVKKKKK